MEQKKFKIVLQRTTSFIDRSKAGNARFEATLDPGEYIATIIENPSGEKGDSNWFLFEGTDIGATLEYVKQKADSITALS